MDHVIKLLVAVVVLALAVFSTRLIWSGVRQFLIFVRHDKKKEVWGNCYAGILLVVGGLVFLLYVAQGWVDIVFPNFTPITPTLS
jgi:hypothetical protein